MKSRFKITAFLLIMVLAAFLRLWNLNNVPPSASLDEVSIGWNAYSILETGKDEYGAKFPILLRAYDDWRPALYVYFVIPFVKLFGLNVLAVRLASAIFGILTVIATYYLVLELFSKWEVRNEKWDIEVGSGIDELKNSKTQKITHQKSKIFHLALLTSLLLAISPWHIYISRLGHEANAGLAFLVIGVLFLLKEKIVLSVISLVLSLISYQSEKIIIPLMLASITILFYKKILLHKKQAIVAGVIALIILVPFSIESLKPDAMIRFKGTNVLKEALTLTGKVKIVTKQYFSHFNPRWLFSNSGKDAHKVPNMGLLNIWELPFILIGIYVFFVGVSKVVKVNAKIKALIFIWFLSSPLPAAVTTQAPHAMRTYTFLPIWQIFGALGIFFLYKKFKELRKTQVLSFVFLVAFSLITFYKNYFVVFPKEQSDSFQYAMHQSVSYVLENEAKYKKIIFSNKNNLYQSYMFFLFGSKYDPDLYQKQGGTVSGGYAETHKFGKYEFRPIAWEEDKRIPGNLLIGNINDFPKNIHTIKFFTNRDGQTRVIAVGR
jgi:hypothetical protein